jgi:mannose-6-phosphate isomerase-like protein (cupin superfamily)
MKHLLIVMILIALPLSVSAQERGERDLYNLDPKPFDPAVDPDGELFMNNWQDSARRTVFGALSEWDILTPSDGDSERPKERGAVLTAITGLSFATLDPGMVTTPATLVNEQKIFYFSGGKGVLIGGPKITNVRDGIGVIIPPGIEFTIENLGGATLAMYIITEPIPAGFTPKTEIVVKDEKGTKWSSNNVHWSHNYKGFIGERDGLAVLTGMGPVWYMPETIGQPHTHGDPVEEIWFSLYGDTTVLLGKQFMHMPPGSAYKIPPTGYTGHSNINASDKPIKMFWMMKRGETTKTGFTYGQLDGRAYDPATESRIDMFISGWREHMQYSTHGTLIERDMFTQNDGDPVRPTDRGGVLKHLDRFTFATLMEGDITAPTTLTDTQELFYITEGRGTVTGGGKTFALYPGVAFLAPKGLEFVMENESPTPMTMYVVAEKVTADFTPVADIFWRDENVEPFHTTTAHWVNSNRWLVKKDEGLQNIAYTLTVTIPPDKFAQPHSHGAGTEEIWTALDAPVTFMLGKQLRTMQPGEAYLIPTDEKTPHANFNQGAKPVKMMYIGLFGME